ncbi:MAG: Mg2+/Co2+ transporter [Verrucomicrobiaceae bacterium]|nr:Mg2+/Co2+ transporter [Verrucomicrobiaceae bacterium]
MPIDNPDSGGLICGFLLQSEGAATLANWDYKLPDMPSGPVWLHFNLADTRAANWLAQAQALPEDARELLLDQDNHAACEKFNRGLALTIGDFHHDFNDDPEGFGTLRLYIDQHCLISGRRHPLKAVDQLRREMTHGLEIASTVDLFSHLIHDLGETFHGVIKNLNDIVDDSEDEILAGRLQDQGTELGRIRRLLARLRRHISGNRQAMTQALAAIEQWDSAADISHLRQAVERLDGSAQDLELVQDRARLLQEEIAGRLNEATNRNLYILSLATVALLPINLITGVFGMNTGGLPWNEDPSGFHKAVIVMFVAMAISLGVLHWRRII